MQTTTQKQNVSEFNRDVRDNGGYRYTQNAPYSSIVSNKRMSDEAVRMIEMLGGVKTIIDIGCGDGTYTAELKHRLPAIHFMGFDPAADAVELARQKFPEVEFFVGDILNTQTFPQRTFDLGIIRGVIHHLPTQSDAVKNSTKLSKRIIIIEPNGNNPILKWIEKNSKYHVEHEEQSFTSDFLCSICEQHGYKVRELNFIGFVPFFFPALPSRIIHFFQPLLEMIWPLKKYFGAQIVICAEQQSGS